MARWRDPQEVLEVLALGEAGVRHAEIVERTGVPLATVRLWLQARIPRSARVLLGELELCPSCSQPPHDFTLLDRDAYAYVLALYLGDGCISRAGRGGTSWVLRISLDTSYTGIIESAARAIGQLRGRRPLLSRPSDGRNMVNVTAWGKDWPCLIPQHGPGRKHHRKIELEPWQQEIVDERPQPFLRGLIHTDGWRGVNRVTSKGKRYEYPRYQFSNRSEDIKGLFTQTCEKIGVEWRPWGKWHISVARKESVAILDSFIGPKC